jgi:hypothetical protein
MSASSCMPVLLSVCDPDDVPDDVPDEASVGPLQDWPVADGVVVLWSPVDVSSVIIMLSNDEACPLPAAAASPVDDDVPVALPTPSNDQ